MAFTVTASFSSVAFSDGLKVFVLTAALEAGGASGGQSTGTTTTVSLTPNGSNSYIIWGAYNESNSTAFTAAANNAITDNITGGGSTKIGDGTYTGTVTAGTGITVGPSAPAGVNVSTAVYEVLASSGVTPLLDASTPAAVSGSASPLTTASFSPPPGSVLVAVLGFSPTGSGQTSSITDTSGLGLTWTRRATFFMSGGAQSDIWTATVPGTGYGGTGPGASGTVSAASPTTWTHVNNGGNCIVVGANWTTGGTSTITAVTYGGVALSRIMQSVSGGSNGGFDVWGLISGTLPTGSNTVSVTGGGPSSSSHLTGGSVSFVNAGSFGTPVSSQNTTGGTASQPLSVTGTTVGGMIFAASSFGGGSGGGTFSTNSPGTQRWAAVGDSAGGADNTVGGTWVSPGGTQAVGFTNTQSDNWGLIAFEVLPAAGGPAVAVPLVRRGRAASRRFTSRHVLGPWAPHLPAVAPSGVTNVSDSDSFAAADGGEAITASLSSSDTGTGTDGTEKIAFSTAETASAAESGAIGLSGSDSGSGSEGGTIGVSSPDSGTASEAASSTASFSSADTATGGDATGTLTVQTSDAATGTDAAGPPNATLSSADTASAAETGVIHVSAADIGTAAENQAVSVQITDSDSASAAEGQQVTVQGSDSSSAAEAGSTTASLSGSDTGSAADGGTIGVSASDSGTGTDSAGPPNATLSSPETGSAAETGTIGVSAPDSASAAEAGSTTASLSGSDTGSAAEGGTIGVTSPETVSGAEGTPVITVSASDAGTVTDNGFVSTIPVSDADTATATEGNQVIRVSDADSATGVQGGEGGTGGTQVADVDSWHGEDSGYTFLGSSDTASAAEAQLVSPGGADTASAADANTIAWRKDADTALGDDELRTLTGPAVSDADSAVATEGPGRFPFSDADTAAMADNYVLDVWSGMAPYTYLGGRERRIHGPSGRLVASTDHVDPLFLRLAQKIAEADTVEWVSGSDTATASEQEDRGGATVSVFIAPAITVTLEFR